ncbi:MAG: hypothetical protein RR682_15270, partial [Cetobacterium sp.]
MHTLLYLLISILAISLAVTSINLYVKNKAAKKLLIDKLTNLPNHYQYVEDISKYTHTNCTFIKIKLNILSEINKRLGWDIGNKIILNIANI